MLEAGFVLFYHQFVYQCTVAQSVRWSGTGLKALLGLWERLTGMPNVSESEGMAFIISISTI
jgi:hypothetical protein